MNLCIFFLWSTTYACRVIVESSIFPKSVCHSHFVWLRISDDLLDNVAIVGLSLQVSARSQTVIKQDRSIHIRRRHVFKRTSATNVSQSFRECMCDWVCLSLFLAVIAVLCVVFSLPGNVGVQPALWSGKQLSSLYNSQGEGTHTILISNI